MKRIRKRYSIPAAFAFLVLAGFLVLSIMNRPLSKETMNSLIDKKLEKMVKSHDEISSAVLTIYSDTRHLNETYAAGYTGENLSEPVTVEHPWYSASIGKTFTASLIGILCEQGRIGLDNPISQYLDDSLLEGLFVFGGTDYSNRVTVRHLLAHISGIGDYYEDPVVRGDTMTERLKSQPDKVWTPLELVAFTREYQQAVSAPGDTFHYSDTGYILLGFIIEKVTGQEFHEVMHENILDPLDMYDTYVVFKSKPVIPQKLDILEVYIDGIDFSDTNILSFDWSGGGLITTMSDLLKFSKALHGGKIVSADTLAMMTDFRHEYDNGVHYGLGMMEFRFGEFSPFLKGLPDICGGVGSTSAFMMYDTMNDIHIIANFGSVGFMEESVPFLADVLMTVDRLRE